MLGGAKPSEKFEMDTTEVKIAHTAARMLCPKKKLVALDAMFM